METGISLSAHHFIVRENDRKPACPCDLADIAQWLIQHLSIQKDQGIDSLVLCSRGHVPLHSEMFQKRPHLGSAHCGGMVHATVADEEANPVAVTLPGTNAVMLHAQDALDLIHQPRLPFVSMAPPGPLFAGLVIYTV
jgi:hypothetical protein